MSDVNGVPCEIRDLFRILKDRFKVHYPLVFRCSVHILFPNPQTITTSGGQDVTLNGITASYNTDANATVALMGLTGVGSDSIPLPIDTTDRDLAPAMVAVLQKLNTAMGEQQKQLASDPLVVGLTALVNDLAY